MASKASKTLESSAFKFPFEITAQILTFATQVNFDTATLRPKFIVSPLVLCRVCKAWQSYISSSPMFWSHIIIVLSQAMRRTYIQEMNRWLNRAQGRGLDVYIDGYRPKGKTFHLLAYDAVLDFLISNSTHWRTIDASCNMALTLPIYLSPDLGPFTLLHTLIIRKPLIPTHLRASPALKTLQVVGFTSPFSILPVLNAHSGNIITSLTLSYNCYDSSCSLLKAFPYLVEAEFHYAMDYLCCPCPKDDFSCLRHANIRSLKICTRISGGRMNVPSHLEAPGLEDLHISIERRCSQDCDLSDITRLVCQSGCHLVRLTLQLTLPEECHIVQLLDLLPSLAELHLRDLEPSAEYSSTLGLSRTFFDALHPHARNVILPALRFITLEGTLALDTLDAFEGLLLRLGQTWITKTGTGGGSSSDISVVKLQFVKIQADQKGLLLEEKDSIFKSDLKSFMEKNALWLLNSDGRTWI